MQEFLDFFGHGFCHQIRERTLEAGGVYFSVCARDTGIYLGLAITVLLVCLLYRRRALALIRPSGIPPLPVIVIAIIVFFPMALDGVSSYLHLRETNNLIRFFSGYGAGMGIGLVASSAVLGMLRGSRDEQRALSRPRHVAAILGLSLLSALVFWLAYPWLGIVSPFIVVLAFLAIMVMLNALILSLARRFNPPVGVPVAASSAGQIAGEHKRDEPKREGEHKRDVPLCVPLEHKGVRPFCVRVPFVFCVRRQRLSKKARLRGSVCRLATLCTNLTTSLLQRCPNLLASR
ncbi:MAG: DUF2085 domain-containing protein [Coriobacteriales bacterium]|jgi:uncharacterized membrane protein|nr:DUF2085 domain-containing protein [Coriobacteriales bacterium]